MKTKKVTIEKKVTTITKSMQEVYSVTITDANVAESLFNTKIGDQVCCKTNKEKEYTYKKVKSIEWVYSSEVELGEYFLDCIVKYLDYENKIKHLFKFTTKDVIETIGLDTLYQDYKHRFIGNDISIEDFEKLIYSDTIEIVVVSLVFTMEDDAVVKAEDCIVIKNKITF